MCQAMFCNYLNHFLSNKDWYQTHNYIKFYLGLHPIPAIVISVAHDSEIEFFVFQSFWVCITVNEAASHCQQCTRRPFADHLPGWTLS